MMPATVAIPDDDFVAAAGFFDADFLAAFFFAGLRAGFFFVGLRDAFFLALFFAGLRAGFFLPFFLAAGFFFEAFFAFFADFFLVGLRRLVAMGRKGSWRGVTGQPQHAFCEDISLHLSGTAPDGEGAGEQRAFSPLPCGKNGGFMRHERPAPAHQDARSPDQPESHVHHFLTVLIGEDLANAGLWAGFGAGKALHQRAHADELEQDMTLIEPSYCITR